MLVFASMIAALAFPSHAVAPRQPPVWPTPFSAKVTQVTTVPGLKNWTFSGEYFYDFETGGNLWISRGAGQLEPECIEVYPSSEGKECYTLSTTWNGFHVVVPEDRLCCHWGEDSLNTPVRPDWLVLMNATFIGIKEINGTKCEGWRADGGNKNIYYSTADDKRLPCQLYMGDEVTPHGIQTTFGMETTFDIGSIRLGAVDKDLFNLPTWCDEKKQCDYPWGPTAAPSQDAILI